VKRGVPTGRRVDRFVEFAARRLDERGWGVFTFGLLKWLTIASVVWVLARTLYLR
jgi:hypothetical protein